MKSMLIHLRSDNEEFMTYANVNYVVDELSESLLSRYQRRLTLSKK